VKQFDNTNRGLLAKNDRKQNENQPDYTGSININGVEYWLSGWLKTGQNGRLAGQKFFSLSIKPKDGLAEPRPAPKQQQVVETFSDDDIADIPF
jgi:hypothetical protein